MDSQRKESHLCDDNPQKMAKRMSIPTPPPPTTTQKKMGGNLYKQILIDAKLKNEEIKNR
jgi:hypothetical protein